MSKADVGRAVDATLDTITEALKKKDDVRLVGFGTLTVAERAASKDAIHRSADQDSASKQARFKAGKALKDALNV